MHNIPIQLYIVGTTHVIQTVGSNSRKRVVARKGLGEEYGKLIQTFRSATVDSRDGVGPRNRVRCAHIRKQNPMLLTCSSTSSSSGQRVPAVCLKILVGPFCKTGNHRRSTAMSEPSTHSTRNAAQKSEQLLPALSCHSPPVSEPRLSNVCCLSRIRVAQFVARQHV